MTDIQAQNKFAENRPAPFSIQSLQMLVIVVIFPCVGQ